MLVSSRSQNSPLKPLQVPKDSGQALNVLGTPMLIRIHGRDTGGVLSVVETADSPGISPPPHIHRREDETFQILDGEYEFVVGNKTIKARAGDTVFAPRDVPHSYRFVGQGQGRLMCIITPAGFEKFFEEVSAMTAEAQKDIPKIIELGSNYGLEFLPPA